MQIKLLETGWHKKKEEKRKNTHWQKRAAFNKKKAIFVNSAAHCCPSLNYHFKHCTEKTILQLTAVTGAAGTEELSSDRISVLIGFLKCIVCMKPQLSARVFTATQRCRVPAPFLSIRHVQTKTLPLWPDWTAALHGNHEQVQHSAHVLLWQLSAEIAVVCSQQPRQTSPSDSTRIQSSIIEKGTNSSHHSNYPLLESMSKNPTQTFKTSAMTFKGWK